MPAENTGQTITIEEANWRNKVCLQLGSLDQRMLGIEKSNNELKEVSKEQFKLLNDKIEKALARKLPCTESDEKKNCEPVKIVKTMQRKMMLYIFSGVVSLNIVVEVLKAYWGK